MERPKPQVNKPEVDSTTTELIEILCEITADTAEANFPAPCVDELERRLKPEPQAK